MYYVYKYTDKNDGIIKYIGIVYGQSRSLSQRIKQHLNDYWNKEGDWKIEYFSDGLSSRTECETWESHLIAKHQTFKWYNKAKSNWGICKFLENETPEWKLFNQNEINGEEFLISKFSSYHRVNLASLGKEQINEIKYLSKACSNRFTKQDIYNIAELIDRDDLPKDITKDIHSKYKFIHEMYCIFNKKYDSIISDTEPLDHFFMFRNVVRDEVNKLVAHNKLRKKYSRILYDELIILLHCDRNYYYLNDLKEILECTSYKRYPDFRRKVIEPAIEEINKYTDLQVDFYTTEKRSISKIYFNVERKRDIEIKNWLKNISETP